MNHQGGTKKVIIIVVILLLVVALAIGGVIVYATTDLFRSNETLFFKYLGQTLQNMQTHKNSQMVAIENLKEEMPYKVDGTLTLEPSEEYGNMELTINSNVDKAEEKSYTKTQLNYNNQDIFTLEYANSNNIYALKSDEIVTAFLGIENNNLKVLMQKLGVTDTSMVPDTLETADIEEIFAITEEEKQHILETYSNVIKENIDQSKFTKEKGLTINKDTTIYKATAYRLTLSEEDLKQIQIAILEQLKQDSITLNFITTKAKLLGLEENYTQVNKLTNEIQELIDKIKDDRVERSNKTNEVQKQIDNTTSLENEISIVIYVNNRKVVTTEVIIKNVMKCTFYTDTKENVITDYMLIEDLSADAQYNQIEIKNVETRNNEQTVNNITINCDDTQMDIYITNDGSAEKQQLITECEIAVVKEDEEIVSIKYEQELTFDEDISNNIIELSRKNCGILNDYTTDEIQVLMQSIVARIITVFSEKLPMLTGLTSGGTFESNETI